MSGRCLPDGGVPAIQSARRLVVSPVDVAYIRRGDGANGGALPEVATLGQDAQSEALLLLRFSVPIPKEANVLEAYLLLERSHAVDVDPTPITFHAARIEGPWDGRSITWALQPRVADTLSPSTTVIPTGRTLVRLDVRDLVQHWRLHDPRDQGLAVVAETTSPTGMAFALTAAPEAAMVSAEPSSSASSPTSPASSSGGASSGGPAERATSADSRTGAQRAGPRLELYIK